MKNYVHGGDCYRNQVEYDFSVNINPLGMPEESRRAAMEGITLSHRYPDYRGEELRLALAKAEGVKTEQIILGNGAAELIYGLCHALRPEKCLIPVPTFQEYEAAVLSSGGKAVYFELREEEDFRLSDEILSAITDETALFFLCNPNNPTGSLTDRALLWKIAQRCEETDTWFCLDECFLPFLKNEEELTMKKELMCFPHMVILRAFTKIYGMPGLRLGYALTAGQELSDRLNLALPPWNTSILAQMAGAAALRDREYLCKTRDLIQREKEFLVAGLSKGIADKIYPSSANYILFKSRKDLKERLLEQKILIRSCENFKGLSEGFFRVSVRTHEENCELIRRCRNGGRNGKSNYDTGYHVECGKKPDHGGALQDL